MSDQDDLEAIIEEYHRAGVEIVGGNPDVYKALYSRADDVTLANPFGPAVRGWSQVSETLDQAAARYEDGRPVGIEPISKHVTEDLAYTVEIERYETKVGGSDELTPVSVRVTTIYRRENGGWKVIHRHADPITSPQPTESVIEK